MTGRDVGEAGQRKMTRRRCETGRVLRCANWIEAVGKESVEVQGCLADNWTERGVMETHMRRRKWRCMLEWLKFRSKYWLTVLGVGVSERRAKGRVATAAANDDRRRGETKAADNCVVIPKLQKVKCAKAR
jgi:hypothetical protein